MFVSQLQNRNANRSDHITQLKEISLNVEMIDYFSVASTLDDLSEFLRTTVVSVIDLGYNHEITKSWNGTSIKIHKTYDSIAAKYIGQEHLIISRLVNEQRDVLAHLIGESADEKYNIFNGSLSSLGCLLRNQHRSIDYITIKPENLSVKYILPLWHSSQQKFSFLPRVFDIAKLKSCRIIVLFDHDSDWTKQGEEEEQLTVQDVSLDVMLISESKDTVSSQSVLSWVCVGTSRSPPSSSCAFKTISETFFDLKKSGNEKPLVTIEERGLGYHCAILRCAGWERGGGMPRQDVWDGLLSLYRSACDDMRNTVFGGPRDPGSCVPHDSVLLVDCGAALDGSAGTHWGVGSRAGTFMLTDIGMARCAAGDVGGSFSTVAAETELSGLFRERFVEMRDVVLAGMRPGTQATSDISLSPPPPPPTTISYRTTPTPTTAMTVVCGKERASLTAPASEEDEEDKLAECADEEAEDGCDLEKETEAERAERLKSARMLEMVGGMMHHDTKEKVDRIEAEEEAVRIRKLAAELKYTTAQAATIIHKMSKELDRKKASTNLQRRLSGKGNRIILPPLPPPSHSPMSTASPSVTDTSATVPIVLASSTSPRLPPMKTEADLAEDVSHTSALGGLGSRGVSICAGLWELVRCAPQLCVSQTQYKAVYKTVCRHVREGPTLSSGSS